MLPVVYQYLTGRLVTVANSPSGHGDEVDGNPVGPMSTIPPYAFYSLERKCSKTAIAYKEILTQSYGGVLLTTRKDGWQSDRFAAF